MQYPICHKIQYQSQKIKCNKDVNKLVHGLSPITTDCQYFIDIKDCHKDIWQLVYLLTYRLLISCNKSSNLFYRHLTKLYYQTIKARLYKMRTFLKLHNYLRYTASLN